LLTDVSNSLLGPRSAAQVFSPQKGATTAADVDRLDEGLRRLHAVFDAEDGPGLGAAGGTAYGLVAAWGATVITGSDFVMDHAGASFAGADLVITGEGAFDETSLHGKLTSAVIARCSRLGVPVTVIAGKADAGSVGTGVRLMSLTDLAGSAQLPLAEPQTWLARAAAHRATEFSDVSPGLTWSQQQ
jgi:glycerate kinase